MAIIVHIAGGRKQRPPSRVVPLPLRRVPARGMRRALAGVMRTGSLPVAALLLAAAAMAAPAATSVLGAFEDGWERQWETKGLDSDGNRADVVVEDGDPVLNITSSGAAVALVREYHVEPLERGTLSWQWKVDRSLTGNSHETEKKGDDYAARVLVVFEKSFFPWRHVAVCYVWAAHEAVGSAFASPYSGRVATIVLQSGDGNAGRWVTERRDLVADYEAFFGRLPKRLSGFAVMVDTDQTDSTARAWFDDMILEIE